MSGHILQLSVKPKTPGEYGLPKRPVPELRITAAGAEGDHNQWRTTKANSDPDLAILLLTQEVLDQLRSEGWPVQPGDIGENITLADIPEAALQPGAQVRLGSVVLQVTKPCEPCTELHSLPYVGPERGKEFVRTMMNRRGWYARVVTEGVVRVGTSVSVVPASATRVQDT